MMLAQALERAWPYTAGGESACCQLASVGWAVPVAITVGTTDVSAAAVAFECSNLQYLLTGESAGGMMVHAILCESNVIPGLVDAAIDMLGGIGADYARGPKCASSIPVPFLKLHGIEDPFITYSKDIIVDDVNFASSIEGTQLRAKANGCGPDDAGKKDVPEADGKMLCTDYCGGTPNKFPAKLCGMPGVGHDTDHPHPGFVYEQSWAWFQELVKNKPAGGKVAPKAKTTAKSNTTKAAKAAAPPEPLELNITYPGDQTLLA